METTEKIYCCGCRKTTEARGASGIEIYPHREDLGDLQFFVCKTCNNYVGTHRATCKPLGCIPTPALREARKIIHATLDPIWLKKKEERSVLYSKLSEKLGYTFHTADIKSITQANKVLLAVNDLTKEYA